MPCLECCGRIGRKAQNLPPTLCMCSSVSPASPSSIPLLSITRLEPCVCKSWIVKLRDMSSGLLNWKRRKIISLKCLPYGYFFQNGAQPCSSTDFTRGNFFRPYILTMQVGRKIYMTKMKLMNIFFSWMVCWFFISRHAFMEHIVQKLHLNYCSKRNC